MSTNDRTADLERQNKALLAEVRRLRNALRKYEQTPCNIGLFADERQMDLADRRDLT